jgi:hypothetical protein
MEGGIYQGEIFYEMHYNMNENILTEKISQVLLSGFISSKEVGASYGKDSRDDSSNTQGTSPYFSICLNTFRF